MKSYITSKFSIVIISALLILVSTTCKKGAEGLRSRDAAPLPPLPGNELPGDKERFESYVYSVEKLKKDMKQVIVLDARTRDDYENGHLPGAVQAHWTEWSNVKAGQGDKGWAVILSGKIMKEKLSALGIDGTKAVVIYNDPLHGWGEDGRQLWTLRAYGLKNTYILNGGIKAWAASGGKVVKEETEVNPVSIPELESDPDINAETEYISANLDKVKILDVREDEEFAGLKVYGEKKKGRIPGAKHIWFKDFFNIDGTMQSPAQIRARAKSAGLTMSDEVICYCTGGIRSGLALIALRIAGYCNVRNYTAGYSEWAGTGQNIDTSELIIKSMDNRNE